MRRLFSPLKLVLLAIVALPASLRAEIMASDSGDHGTPVSSPFVLGPTNRGPGTIGKWGASGVAGTPGGVVTYSFMATGTSRGVEGSGSYTHLNDFMPAGWQTEIANAFAAWSAVADIQFMEVADGGGAFNVGAVGHIRIGGENLGGPGGTLAHGFYPPNNGVTAAGDIHFDTGDTWKIGFGGPGFDIFFVALHEIGHAIGLDHTGVPNSVMNPSYTETLNGLQPDDIAGAQFIYGPAVVAAAVPEPSSWVAFVLMLGVIGIVGFRRMRAAPVAC